MAAAASSNSGCSSNSKGWPLVKCYHNETASLRVVKHNGPTYGKRFYGCTHYPNFGCQFTCGFFKWEDEVLRGCSAEMEERNFLLLEKETKISELEHGNKLLEDKVKKLKLKKES